MSRDKAGFDPDAQRDAERAREQVTRVLQEFGECDDAAERLLPLVYDHLRMIARQRMRRERGDHTLQATALVHEAYVRLLGDESKHNTWQNRAHFYGAAAEAMRRILIDHARKKQSQKRGGAHIELPMDLLDLASDAKSDVVLAIDDAVEKLQKEDPQAATVVRLRFFAGLSVDETADALQISKRTVMRDWAFARARLYELLKS